jgi:glycine cleavage system regulatory protein
MPKHLVLTLIGPDRPGLVHALSETVASAGGNWLDARMATLAGQFAGILLVAVDAAKSDALLAALRKLETHGLELSIAQADGGSVPSAGAHDRLVRIELVGLDRPGIVRDISRAIAARNASITELESELVSGSFSGEAMFKAQALVLLPPDVRVDDLRADLESLANELMVDLELEDGAST